MRGRTFRKGLQKGRRWPKNRGAPTKKRSSKKFWDMRQKSRGAANLRSAPGGRHSSYATGNKSSFEDRLVHTRKRPKFRFGSVRGSVGFGQKT